MGIVVSVSHLLDLVVPVDQDVPDGADPLLHEGHVPEDLQLLFLGLSFERIGDADKVLPHLSEAAIRLDLLVRKMLLGTVAQGASAHIVADGQAAFLGLPLDDVALFLSDTGVQVQGAPGSLYSNFLFHADKLCWSAPMRAWEHTRSHWRTASVSETVRHWHFSLVGVAIESRHLSGRNCRALPPRTFRAIGFYGQPDQRLGLGGRRDPFGLSRPIFSFPLLKNLLLGQLEEPLQRKDLSWLRKSFPLEKREVKSMDGESIQAKHTRFITSVQTAS